MITLSLCLVGVVLSAILVVFFAVPLALLLGFAPMVLGIAGVVLLIRGLLEKPITLQSFAPAAAAFLASALLRWIF